VYCSKHGLWSDSFHKEYLMVLPYLKGSLYIVVLFIVIVKLRASNFYLPRFNTSVGILLRLVMGGGGGGWG
jgi:hypothetical protein